MFENEDMKFTELTKEETEAELIKLGRKLVTKDFSYALTGTNRWENGWAENLNQFLDSNDINDLVPRYVLRTGIKRLDGKLIRTNEKFELEWIKNHQRYLFQNFKHFDHIYEFGCGSCYNLAVLRDMFPGKKLHGLDWSKNAVKIAQALGAEGTEFDMLFPSSSGFELEPDSAVLTWGAVEQLGGKVAPFLNWLRDQKPGLVIHSEPIVEWYTTDNLLDILTILIHRERKFVTGLPEMLKKMPGVEVLREHRTGFGSTLLEGYSQLWWKGTDKILGSNE